MPSPKKPPKGMKKPTPDLPEVKKEKQQKKENDTVKKQEIKMGRPTVMTDDVLHMLKQAFYIGCTDKEACAFAGISEKTLYNYTAENPDFLREKEDLKKQPILKAKKMVYDNIDRDVNVAKWYLEKKCRKEFGNAMDLDLTVKEKPDLSQLSPDVIKKLAEQALNKLKQ